MKLNDPQSSAEQIEASLCRDVGFSYRILKCVNSSYFQMPRQISSIREAVLLLGVGEIHKLCWLVLLAGLSGEPGYICIQALTRARMCELLAVAADNRKYASTYFMAGMLTLIHVVLRMPFEDALRTLSLRPPVLSALLWQEGDLGEALSCVTSYERGNWDGVEFAGLNKEQVATAYLEAVAWAERIWKHFHKGI
jgi:EAL and modified HD-GYP domain-containing signal transduction protein